MRNKHAILSAKGLHKQYGKRMVVKDVDVSLERGEIVGLLGPNGAGKTTSFYMITGMIKPTKGNTLSGGERRRVEIARCLCMDPDFILLDEPFAGVDPIAVEEIQGIVHSLKQKKIGVLITDHNVRETLSITDRSYLLFDGQILKSGTSESLANDEEARRLYLGEKFRLD